MAIGIIELNHVNVTVPADLEHAAKEFYGELLGLKQIPKPEGPRQFVGAWYQIGSAQLHLSIEEDSQAEVSDRHVCYRVADLVGAAARFTEAGLNIVPDIDTSGRLTRFFIRDPAGNRIEIAE